MIHTNTFGTDEVHLPSLGLGCARIGSFNNPSTNRQTMALLERALELGVSLFDTADVYGQGDSERAIGRLLKGRRNAGIVLTKAGIVFSAKAMLARPLKPILKPLVAMVPQGRHRMAALRENVVGYNFEPERIQIALEGSLRRLKTDFVDIYLLHNAPRLVIEDHRTVETLTRLLEAGKIRTFGVSCGDIDSLATALDMPGLQAVEVTLAMLDELSERQRRIIFEKKIGVVVREALRSRGLLTPTEVVAKLVRRSDVTATVIGTTSISHLEEVAKSAALRPLVAKQAPTSSLSDRHVDHFGARWDVGS